MSWRASVALVVSRVTIGLRVMIALTGVVWGSRPSADTCARVRSAIALSKRVSFAHPVCQIFGSEDTTQAFLIVDNKNAIGSFGSTKLAGFSNSDVFGHCECRGRLQSGDSSLRGSCLSSSSATLRCSLGSRNGPLPSEFRFDFLANGLGNDRKGLFQVYQFRGLHCYAACTHLILLTSLLPGIGLKAES